jgi:diguanylate cyclase (GGDEF)-like protein
MDGRALELMDRRTVRTVALTVGLALTGAGLAVGVPSAALLGTPERLPFAAVLAGLAVTFFVAEHGQALVEVRRQAYAFSLSGVPLLLGLLYCPPRELIAIRVAAAAAAFAVQRSAPLKFSFNTASYLLDTALVIAVSHALLDVPASLGMGTALGCYAALAAVDLVMSGVVVLVIRINEGPVSRAEAAEIFLPAGIFVALNTALGFIAAILLSSGTLGAGLLVTFIAVTAVVYRGYLVLRRRHRSLELVADFVRLGEGTHSVEELCARLLGHIRSVLRASRVSLTAYDIGRPGGIRVVVDETDRVTFTTCPAGEREDALPPDAALLLDEKSTDPRHRRWLARHDAHDAVVSALPRSGVTGSVAALDRLGDTTRFTRDDLSLLRTLAGHLAVALHGAELVQRLRHDATHDVLTGLPNRALLTERIVAALAEPADDRRAAVLLLDLDRFKEVNDALGHHVGDQLLKVVADRLRALPLPGATVARLGGDEFAVLLPPAVDAERLAIAAAELVTKALQSPVDLPDGTVSTEGSIGVAIATPEQSQADLLRHADTAMYAAKASGLRFTVYAPALDEGRAQRLELLAELHLALEHDELEVHYQPKLDLARGLVTGVEALVRWSHPRLGRIRPDAFIPLAESTGLIQELTRVVLTKALRQCRDWQDAGLDLAVAVNLSARNVNNPALPDIIAAALATAGLPAHKLILEITESSVMGDADTTVPILNELAALGVVLSLDDFGTGYSSLSYLHRLPVREVKIDRSFVLGLMHPEESRASAVLIRSITGLGTSLGLRIVAEGVESAETLEQLRDLGCDVIQGYHVGRPMSAQEFDADFTATRLHRRRSAYELRAA